MDSRKRIVPKKVCRNRAPLGVLAAAAAVLFVFATGVTCISAVSSASVGKPEKDVPKFDANPPVQKAPTLEKGVLLVAAAGLPDPNFAKSVVLLADYGSHGAIGLYHQPPHTEFTLTEAFPDIPGIDKRKDRLFAGGPVGIEKARYIARFDVPPKGAHLISRRRIPVPRHGNARKTYRRFRSPEPVPGVRRIRRVGFRTTRA